jgi:hypothetical protein
MYASKSATVNAYEKRNNISNVPNVPQNIFSRKWEIFYGAYCFWLSGASLFFQRCLQEHERSSIPNQTNV